MAEDAQSSSSSKLLGASDPHLLTTSSNNSSTMSYSSAAASILGLAASKYNKLHLGSKIKPPDLSATAEDYNNNNIDGGSGLSKAFHNNNNNNDSNCENYHQNHNHSHHQQHHFISVDSCLSDKWNGIRSDSPFLASTMISPPLPPATVPQSSSSSSMLVTNNLNNKSVMCPSGMSINNTTGNGVPPPPPPGGLIPSHQSMLGNQLLSNSSIICNNHNTSSSSNGAGITHKCANTNGILNGQQVKKGENCMTHAMPNTLWCLKCHTLICRACAGSDEHRNHTVKTQAKEAIRTEIASELGTMQKSLIEVQHLVLKQRDFLLKILESCSSLKSQIENELINHSPTMDVAELRDSFCRAKLCLNVLDQSAAQAAAAAATQNGGNSNGQSSSSSSGNSNGTSPTSPTSPTPIELYKLYTNLTAEKQRLHLKYQDLYLQCKFDDLLRNAGHVIDYETISRAMQTLHIGGNNESASLVHSAPLLLMANYCLTQIYTRQQSAAAVSSKQLQQHQQQMAQSSQQQSSLALNNHSSSGNNNNMGSHTSSYGHSASNNLVHQDSGFSFSHSNASNTNTSTQQAAANNIHISQFGGTKSPFLDLAVGSPASNNSGMAHLNSGSLSHMHPQQHSLHFGQSQQVAPINHSSPFGHSSSVFSDNLLLSNAFQQQQQQQQTVATNHHNHHGIASSLNALRHNSGGGIGSGPTTGGGGAGGISFEMNGISVPINMMSTQKSFPSGLPSNGGGGTISAHHSHHHSHHLLHSVAAANLSSSSSNSSGSNSIICNPTVHIYPIYYFNIEINGQPCGRILIEVRNDVAPRMAKNFGALASGELGFGYKGCQIFQCWENESIITGDFELNNGRGGRSVFEDGFFMPDDTKILAIRGSVGMRRSQKRHDNMGLVGSQFRIILREMRGFTGIFAFVIEGLELVEKISQTGDSAGKPQSSVLIVSCGKLQ